jgi:hypothetical protein
LLQPYVLPVIKIVIYLFLDFAARFDYRKDSWVEKLAKLQFGAATPSITTISITTLSITKNGSLSEDKIRNNTQHLELFAECLIPSMACFFIAMLSGVVLNDVMLSVVAPFVDVALSGLCI